MFTSFRSKMLLLIVGILVVSSAAIMALTGTEVTRVVGRTTRDAARNQLSLVKLDIENQYKSIVYHREYALLRYKEQLRNLVAVVIAHIDSCERLYEAGVLTENQAKQFAAESVRRFKFGNNDYFFIYDEKGMNISHPDPGLHKKDLWQYRDVKGKYVVRDVIKTARTRGSGFDSFWHIRLGENKPVEKLSYVELYRKWNWIVGTGVYIDDIQKDEDVKIARVLSDLKDTFSRITIGKTGYFYLFDDRKQMLLHPERAGTNVAGVKDPVRGTNHYDDIVRASATPGIPFVYLWNKPPDHPNEYRFLKEGYADYFAPLGWYVVASVYKDEIDAPVKKIVTWQIVLTITIIVLSCLLALFLVGRMTGNLKLLSFYARSLSRTDFHMVDEIRAGIKSLAGKSKDEIAGLADAFAFMIGSLTGYIEKLKETTAAKEKIESELKIAHEIQMSMVPHPPGLTRETFGLFAVLEPAREVGGDFYDFFFIDDTRLCLVIGDVTDKGVPAALFMARSKTVIRLLAAAERGPAFASEILTKANNVLCEENDHVMFTTIFLAVLNVETGELDYANAGHNPPYLMGPDLGAMAVPVTPGRPLGIRRETSFKGQAMVLSQGQALFMFTDGVTEAMDSEGRLFGEERLLFTLRRTDPMTSPEDMAHRVLDAVRAHSAGSIQSDDITMLCVRYLGPAAFPGMVEKA